jgi:FkbM family methyltransferase
VSVAEFVYTELLKYPPLRRLTNSLLLKIIPRATRVGPATLYLDQDDPVLSGAVTLRVYERGEIRFFRRHCRGDLTFVDVGANVGLYTALAMHTLGAGGRIVAIEPRPQSFALLAKTITANRTPTGPRVDAYAIAAAPEAGRRILFQNPDNKADNRVYASRDCRWEEIEVEARPLDDVLAESGIDAIGFLKIDVQGFEQMVLRSLRATLRRSASVVLMSELWPKGLREAGGGAETYLDELEELGFEVFELGRGGALQRLTDRGALIRRLAGRKYTNVVGVKGRDVALAWARGEA